MKIGIVKMAAGKHREPNVERQFLPQGSELFIVDFTGDRRKLAEDLRGLDALLVSYVPIDAEILDALDICQAIAVPAVGWNWIDAPAAWKKGIAVMANGPYCTQEVADHTLALLLALNRRLMDYHRGVQADGLWKWDAFPDIRRLEGQTLGILGFGAIGRAVARRAQAFGIRVVAHDPFVPESLAREMDVELLDAPELLARADVVSNHMNLNETNRGFFNRETFALMRRKPLLINVGRGETVIEADLARALDEGVVSGAGLDVLAQEEPELEGPPLRGRPNVILTPHMAFYSDTALFDCLRIACQNLTYYLNGEHDKVNQFVPRE